MQWIAWLENLTSDDTAAVGGKNSSLGEMLAHLKQRGIRVPDGFATTAEAYRHFLRESGLEQKIRKELGKLEENEDALQEVGSAIRRMITDADWPEDLAQTVRDAYGELSGKYDTDAVDVAVRSSATAEDLPEASFAGQQESFLNITGADELLDACRKCFASLFTDRAISYRRENDFDHMQIALSVGVQKMVRADKAGAGVMFTIDTETGFPDVVVINANWGLGESVVKGTVNPDEYRVYKRLLDREELRPIIARSIGSKRKKTTTGGDGGQTTQEVATSESEQQQAVLHDDEILQLARWAAAIEEHYDRPMDIEWARDGTSGEMFIVQARPETVESQKKKARLKIYTLKQESEQLVAGLAIGNAVGSGKVFVIRDVSEGDRFEQGGILVTQQTDPDWVPLMKKASGIVTDHGGRTSHAAIVSRELRVPAVIGTGNATQQLEDGIDVTIDCARGEEGRVFKGALEYESEEIDPEEMPQTQTRIMMNIASPRAGFRWWNLPVDGIGLARMEFIINNAIKVHPLALTRFDQVEDEDARHTIEQLTAGYEDKSEYFVDHLAQGIAQLAAARYPDDVIIRLSDFKTNEYADLIGGAPFEPDEANPMLGFRGAARYTSDDYRDGFALECRAIKRAREQIGLNNVVVMVPFCRTPEEGRRVLEVLADHGLKRGENDLRVYVMAELPSNVVLAREFAQYFDGFSIGSNDLTQLVLGVDRDSDRLAPLFDEQHAAVKETIAQLIKRAHEAERKVSICGQAPSDHPEFAAWLVEQGIDSISVNPDSVLKVREHVAEAEKQGRAAA